MYKQEESTMSCRTVHVLSRVFSVFSDHRYSTSDHPGDFLLLLITLVITISGESRNCIINIRFIGSTDN